MIPKRYENATFESVPKEIQDMFLAMPKTKKGIYIHGSVGSGKTHIAHGLNKWLYDNKYSSRFKNTTDLIVSIKEDFEKHGADKERQVDLLIESKKILFLDDIGAEKMTDFVAETFYRIVNSYYQDMQPIIFTSNLSIGELADKVGDRIASRIVEMCDIVEIEARDRRMDQINKITVKV
jgi:DNA replication protein DnaC